MHYIIESEVSFVKSSVNAISFIAVFRYSLSLFIIYDMCDENTTDVVNRLSALKLSLDNFTDKCNYITCETIGSLTTSKTDLKILEWNIRGLLGK